MSDYMIAKYYTKKSDNAKQRGIEFSLTFTQFSKIIKRSKCPVYNITIFKTLGNTNTWERQPEDELTIDRIDSSKGYVMGNCVAMSHKANFIKSKFENKLEDSYTIKDMIQLADYLKDKV